MMMRIMIVARLVSASLRRTCHVNVTFVLAFHTTGTDDLRTLLATLNRVTSMPVVMIQSGIPLQANQVYVAPTHTHVSLEHGEFHATQVDTLEEQGVAIDFLFESLAEENGPYAIGILLSGAVHQALISVASEVGQGTTFTIALPAVTPSHMVEMSE
jgi:two-component system CheB/CheR fusion protein